MRSLDNFKNVKDLGYFGMDASLETALYEYGLVWREVDNDYHFIYGIQGDGETYTLFDHGYISKTADPKEEWSWVDWESVESFFGAKLEGKEIPLVVEALIAYYGYEEILGSAYYPFKIEKENENEG